MTSHMPLEDLLKNLKPEDLHSESFGFEAPAPKESTKPTTFFGALTDRGRRLVANQWNKIESTRRVLGEHVRMQRATMERALLLDPNRYSTIKVYGYSFSLTVPLVMGTEKQYFEETLQPNSKIRPKRMVTNVEAPRMIELSSVQVANVNVLIGMEEDAYIYGPNSFGMYTEFPTLDTSTRATMTGSYSGYTPRDYTKDFPFKFVLTFQGPAALCGNG